MKAKLTKLFHDIETLLSQVYQYPKYCSATDFIVNQNDIEKMNLDVSGRASLLFKESDESNDFFVALYFDDETFKAIEDLNFKSHIISRQMDSLSVLIEEISHFHLVIQKKYRGQKTTRIELETQAEIDKVLISSLLNFNYFGRSEIESFYHQVFHGENSTLSESGPYREANQFAGQFWHQILDSQRHQKDLAKLKYSVSEARAFGQLEWFEKISRIQGFRQSA